MEKSPRLGCSWLPGLALLLLVLAGCGGSKGRPPAAARHSAHPSPTPTAAATSVTVIAPLGVNLRSGPSATASAVGVVVQGVSLPLLAHSSADGGWWEVQGSSQKGWITAAPQYTSTASFQTFQSSGAVLWSVMYEQGWNFAQQSSGAVDFTGPGNSTITVDSATSTGQLPPAAPPGATQRNVSAVVVYGVTAPLITYAASGYQASVELQAQASLALLIKAHLPAKTGSAALKLFLETIFFTVAASPSP